MAAAVKTFPKTVAIPERSSYQYQLTLKTLAGADFQAVYVTDIKLMLRELKTNTVVNGLDGISVLNANNGSLADGLFTRLFDAEDMQAVGTEEYQPRLLTLDFRLIGNGRVTREVFFWLKSMRDIEEAA